MPRFGVSLSCVAVLLLSVGLSVRPARAQGGHFVRSFIDPNAAPKSFGSAALTQAVGVNDAGVVVGSYTGPSFMTHAFEWANGNFLPGNFDVPDPACSFDCGTLANGINNAGEVVGEYDDANGVTHAYYMVKGVTHVYDAPGSDGLTIANAINNMGIFVGIYEDANSATHGFESDGNHFTSFDIPGCRIPQINGVDDKGDVVGFCLGATGPGFEFSPALDALTPIGPPGAQQSRPTGINNVGQIVGSFFDSGGTFHCFIFSGGTQYAAFDPLGSTGTTCDGAINNANEFVGDYFDAENIDHGFLASGPILLDPVPSGTFPGLMQGPATANDNNLPSLALPDAARVVDGVAADGVTEVMVRVPAGSAGNQFTLTVINDQFQPSQAPNQDGALGNPGDTTFSKSQITVSAINVTTDPSTGQQAPFAFAVYRAPIDFVRQNADGSYQSGLCIFNSFSSGFGTASTTPVETIGFKPQTDDQLSCRSVTIQVQDLTNNIFLNLPVIILRPPVVMIHGLWDNWQTWNNFNPLVNGPNSVDPMNRFYVGRVSYDSLVGPSIISSDPPYPADEIQKVQSNSLGFAYNATNVLAQMNGWIQDFKQGMNPLAIPSADIEADIVAHSMGGDIARTMVLQPTFLRDATFGLGSIHKVITIDTPHLGSPLASDLISPQEVGGCVDTHLAARGKYVFNSVLLATVQGGGTLPAPTLIDGAIADLAISSPALLNIANQSPRPLLAAFIAGTNPNFSSPSALALRCSPPPILDPLAIDDLTPSTWASVFGLQPNDAIVAEVSQLNNLSSSSPSAFVFSGVVHSPGSEGFFGLGFGAPSVLDPDSATGIPSTVIKLLNTPITNSAFSLLNP